MAKQAMDAYHEASAPKEGGKKKLDHLEVKPTKNKGHVVEHHYDNSGPGIFMHRPDVHAFGKGPEVIAHLMKHLGVNENEMLAHLEGGHDGEDTEAPGGKGENDELAKAPKHQNAKKTRSEERGED